MSTRCEPCPVNTTTEDDGATTCIPCPFGTSTDGKTGSSYCSNPSCIWYTDSSENTFYNLSPFSGQYQYVGNKEPYFLGYYVISYCGFVNPDLYGCENSMICERFNLFNPINPTVDYLNWASSVSITPLDNPYDGYIMKFRNGDSIECPNQESRGVDVHFFCETDPNKFIPLTVIDTDSTECHLVLHQSNYYGCPICSYQNFTREDGECENGEMTVSYVKNDGVKCNGIMRDTTESCGDINITIGLLLVGSLILFILIAGLVIVAIFIYQKKQKLEYKYKELQKSVAASVEMEDK